MEVTVVTDPGSIEQVWRDLEMHGVCGVAQSYDWVSLWRKHVNPDCLAVLVSEDGRPALILPLEVVTRSLCRVARFPGGSHANCNFPLLSPGFAVSAETLRRLFKTLHHARPDIDLVTLDRQLGDFDGIANPLLACGDREDANIALSTSLSGGFEALLERHSAKRKKKKHRQHARRFEETGGWRVMTARDPGTAERFLNRFFTIKADRFASAGIHDVFAEPQVQAFFKALFGDDAKAGRGIFQVWALEVGGEDIAVSASSSWKDTVTIEFAGFSEADSQSTSPGQFLLHEQLAEFCATPARTFSLGVGDEVYKREWCTQEIVLHDTTTALTTRGMIGAGLAAASGAAKHYVRRNPALWTAAKTLRARLNATASPSSDE